MLLSDIDIKKAIKDGRIRFSPLPDLSVALSADCVDLRLGNQFEIFEHTRVPFFDSKNPPKEPVTKTVTIKNNEPFIVQPGEFILGSTLEAVTLPNDIAGRLEGRSSIGRLGIVVHSTAALIHAGFSGRIVLELGNHSRIPVALYQGMRICSISFEMLSSPAATPYNKQKGAKYRNQKGVSGSKVDRI